MIQSAHTRRSRVPQRPCRKCRLSVPVTALDDDELCSSCADQAPLFDFTPKARSRRFDGRWF